MKKQYPISGKFHGLLQVRYENGHEWVLVNPVWPYLFYFELDNGKKIIPWDGYATDFASIPRAFWSILPPTGDGVEAHYGQAAVIHDWLYDRGEIEGKPINKREADDIFLACMESLNVTKWKREIMHWAVVNFGGKEWSKHKHEIRRGL